MWPLLLALVCLPRPARAGDIEMYRKATDLIDEHYLHLQTFDPALALARAAEAAERAVPWLLVDAADGTVVLRHGDLGTFDVVTIDPDAARAGHLRELALALDELEDAIRRQGSPVPPDVVLSVELLEGMMDALDRHSVILADARLQQFDERIRGKLQGVGARVGRVGADIVVREVFPGGPADRGGLLPGDVLVRIGGVSTAGLTVEEAVEHIRGPLGTSVVIEVRRDHEPWEMLLIREEVVYPNVHWERLPSGVGHVRIDHFSEQTVAFLDRALTELGEEGITGLILDLRGNTGGSMIQSAESADRFLDAGLVVETAGRDGLPVRNLVSRMVAHHDGAEPPVPVAVLMDERSASASEILAGALVLHDRAVVLGQRSYGKGTVQKVYTLAANRVRMKLTVAEYRLEGGVPVTGVGIAPDHAVQPVVLHEGGALLPDDDRALWWVDERPGWRDPPPPEALGERDYLVDLAELVVLGSPSLHRMDLLATLEAIADAQHLEQQGLLDDAFAARGIDWTPAPVPIEAPPDVTVRVAPTTPPRAGEAVELVATVVNRGTVPLYRARVDLSAADGSLPWANLSIPVGRIDPGQSRSGRVRLELLPSAPRREDDVSVAVRADGRPPRTGLSVVLGLREAPEASVAFRSWVEPTEHGHRLVLAVQNTGGRALDDLALGLAVPPGVLVGGPSSPALTLGVGQQSFVAYDLGVEPGVPAPPLDLVVTAASPALAQAIELPVRVPWTEGVVEVRPPSMLADVPVRAVAGSVRVPLIVEDDRGIKTVTAWYQGEKIAWHEGHTRRVELELMVAVDEGTQPIVVEAVDDQGVRTVERFFVRGIGLDGAADEATP